MDHGWVADLVKISMGRRLFTVESVVNSQYLLGSVTAAWSRLSGRYYDHAWHGCHVCLGDVIPGTGCKYTLEPDADKTDSRQSWPAFKLILLNRVMLST